MKHICLAILLLGSVAGAAQKTTTFEIEKLDPPKLKSLIRRKTC